MASAPRISTCAQKRRDTLWHLIGNAHVFSQGYRPGGIAALGFGPQELAARRGFDSLVQTAMCFNDAEARAFGEDKPLPMQMLDMASGFLIAFGAVAALWKQQREGVSWHVQVSLAQTGHWAALARTRR